MNWENIVKMNTTKIILSHQPNLFEFRTHLYLRSNFTHLESFGRALILTQLLQLC